MIIDSTALLVHRLTYFIKKYTLLDLFSVVCDTVNYLVIRI